MKTYGINLINFSDIENADCIIFAVSHNEFTQLSINQIDKMFSKVKGNEKIIIDIKSIFSKEIFNSVGYRYWNL
jgi:UDP-N-acetyl-D-glucosamine/UDP-N-acetyl-D-galactosamine dehydrogenase